MMDSVRCRLVIPGVRLAGTDHGAGGEGLDWSLQGAQHVSNSVIQLTHSPGDQETTPSNHLKTLQRGSNKLVNQVSLSLKALHRLVENC